MGEKKNVKGHLFPKLPLHIQPLGRYSVTRWIDYFSVFGHLQ